MTTIVELGPGYYPDPTVGRPVSNGELYIGEVDLDPEVVANQITVTAIQEDTSSITIPQPIELGTGGVPIYNGSPVTLTVESAYSLKVLDSLGAQVYYVPYTQDISFDFSADHKTDFTHIVYQSVSELRAATLTPFEDQKISITGSISEGDGGGGDWWWDASSTETDNTGTIVKVATITTGRWKRIYSGAVNVLWFGAPGDGIIQDAMDLGESEVIIPDIGTDYIADVLDIPDTLRVLRGIGFPTLISSAAGIRTIDYTGTPGTDGLLITGITFKGYPAAGESSANESINIVTMDNLRIIDNRFENTWVRAMELTNVDYFEVSNNLFKNCSNGPYFIGCGYGIITENTIRNSQQADATFKIGIALMTFDATFGLNHNIVISNNVIEDLENSQAILGHGGIGIVVADNIIDHCAQGVNFNRQTSGDDIIDVSITGNKMRGIDSSVSYTPAGDVGIVVSGTGENTGNVVVANNNIRNFNTKEANDNLGGISIISVDDISITGNMIRNCVNNGLVFSGADSLNVTVIGNSIINSNGGAAHGGIKIDSPTIVSGLFEANYIVECERAYRLETASLPNLVVNATTEFENDEVSLGFDSCTYNGTMYAVDGQLTPVINPAVKTLIMTSTSAAKVTDFLNSYIGQTVVVFDIVGNTTIADDSDSGNFKLLANANWVFGGTTSVITVTDRGTRWLQTSGSANP